MFIAQRLHRAVLSLAFLYSAHIAFAQVDAGTILGTVRDNTGAVISGATVTVQNEGTSFSQTTKTSSSGDYVLTPLKIGNYSVEVEYQGFKKQKRTGIVVDIQQQVVSNFTVRS
jgi:hypothetical protein